MIKTVAGVGGVGLAGGVDGGHRVRVDGAEAVRYARRLGLAHVQVGPVAGFEAAVGIDVRFIDGLLRACPGSVFLDIDRRGTRLDARYSATAVAGAVWRAWWGSLGVESLSGGFWLDSDELSLPAFNSAVRDELSFAGETAEWSVSVTRVLSLRDLEG